MLTMTLGDSPPTTGSCYMQDLGDSITVLSTVCSFYDAGDTGRVFTMASTNLGNKLRLRVVNETTKRYKDVLVEPRDDCDCYEAIYDNQTIKEAHVRKWGSLMAREVKNGSSVIQCVLAGERDDSTNNNQHHVFRVFSLQDLKNTSTAQLSTMLVAMESVLSSMMIQRVLIILQCVKKEDATTSISTTQATVELKTSSCPVASKMESATAISPTCVSDASNISSASSFRRRYLNRTNSFKASFRKRKNLRQSSYSGLYSGMDRLSVVNSETPSIVEVPMRGGTTATSISTGNTISSGISLSPEVVKEVFPYHIVFDEEFQILQVGNRLSKLIDEKSLLERSICDIMKLTGPIPQDGLWDWVILDNMKDKVVFLEPVKAGSRAKIKGTIIEVSESPRQVMLALFPDVKNLAELSSMNLTIGDLPIHSCQRDAVLVGEHSASEVKLTHHLDQRHRDLINSMERQIADRTRELADANRHLEQANATLAQQSARQLEHFACMSHEIRTPLNCIVGMTSIMMESIEEMSPAHAEAVRLINGSGEILHAVVDDVLDFARLSSGSFETVIKSADLQETLDTVVHSIAQKISEKNITLRTHYSADLPRIIETDSRRLQQVCYNLLGNAGKFSKPGSVIDLKVSLIHQSGSNTIRFSVKDYGKGIRRDDFEKIFQPFSQASKETQHLYGGTGLGLSITSKLVERLGGTISVDSEEGKFAEFTVDLPFVGEPVDKNSLKEKLSSASILFVEPREESASEEPVQESSPFQPGIISEYSLDFHHFSSCDNLNCVSLPASGKHVTLLIHEDLYERQPVESFKVAVGSRNCTVMTYGPNYKIAETKALHFKSLSRLIPSIFLETIAGNGGRASLQTEAAVTGESADVVPSAQNCSEGLDGTPKKNLKILYAEDNKVNQKVLRKVLKALGVLNVDIVENGKEAVDITAENSYDLIFMDIQMPVMDGLDATKLITDRDNNAKVIFVTAHALDEFKAKAMAAGGKGFVSKPFRKAHIETLLQSFCGTESEIVY